MKEMKQKSQRTICVEGNIGCGKTTFLNYFSQFKDVEVFQEPVKNWTNLKNNNLLDLMYKDPERWSHLFQTYVQLTMMEQHFQPSNAKTKIMERSIFSARHCFVENMYRSGKMSEVEYLVYCEWFNFITAMTDCKVDLIVYLRTDPAVLSERIACRARSEELRIPLDYLEALHRLHEQWLLASGHAPAPVLVIDANAPLAKMDEIYQKHANEILQSQAQTNRSPLKPIQASLLPLLKEENNA